MFRINARAVRSHPPFVASLLLCACAAFAAPRAHATGATGIQQCQAPDGNAIYTDKPCATFRARPVRLSDDLTIRLALADAGNRAPGALQHASLGAYRDASEPLHASIPGRRSPMAGCARTPQQLSRDLAGAFALQDVNRLAESYYWVGMSQRQALPVMKQLERLSAQPLVDARFLSAWIASGERTTPQMPREAGIMQLVFAGGSRIVDFNVRRHSGCYFIAS